MVRSKDVPIFRVNTIIFFLFLDSNLTFRPWELGLPDIYFNGKQMVMPLQGTFDHPLSLPDITKTSLF